MINFKHVNASWDTSLYDGTKKGKAIFDPTLVQTFFDRDSTRARLKNHYEV